MNLSYSSFVIFILLLGLIFGCGEDSWTKKGKEFLAAGDYKSAVWYFQQAINAKPDNAEAHYQLGLTYRKLRQYDKAIESLRTSAQLSKERVDVQKATHDFVLVQLALGETYIEMGHRKLASRFFLKALQNSDSKDVVKKITRLTGDAYKKTRLTPDYVRAYGPSVASGRVVFTAYVDDNNEIYVIDLNGKNKKRLTFNDTSDYSPCLSPDGTKIVYVSFMRWRNSNDEIYIMDSDGQNQKRFTFNIHSDGNPTFSPDGKLITFESNRDGNSEIYIMDVDGKNQKRLTFESQTDTTENATRTDMRCYSPSFSPDGKQIVFSAYSIESSQNIPSSIPVNTPQKSADSDSYNVVSQIYVMNVDGKNLRQLTDVKAINSNPSFSPDGKKIVFDSNRSPGLDAYGSGRPHAEKFGKSNSGVYIMDADGKNPIRLTSPEYISMEPIFTPDGKKIIFTGQKSDSGNLGIYILDLEKTFTKEELIKRLKGID